MVGEPDSPRAGFLQYRGQKACVLETRRRQLSNQRRNASQTLWQKSRTESRRLLYGLGKYENRKESRSHCTSGSPSGQIALAVV